MNEPPAPVPPSEEELRRALGVFKKRLKLTKLDQESRLGVMRPMSSGRSSEGMGIVPPREYPRSVWAELARQGKIKDMGGGFYTLA